MEKKTNRASNFDEFLMLNSFLFRDSLKDLRSLSKQLYSAAEHFEVSYSKQNQQQIVVETIKDYVNNAIVSTVDHLGSIANKMNEFLDEKVAEVSTAELHVSCLEQKLMRCFYLPNQRLSTVQSFVDRSGFLQESFLVRTPIHHKQYKIPVKTREKQDILQYVPLVEHGLKQSRTVVATKLTLHSSLHTHRKDYSTSPSMISSSPRTFSFARTASNKLPEKRSASPLRFSLKRSGSANGRQQIEKHSSKDIQPYSKKSKPIFKTLLTMYKHNKDGRM